MSFLEMPNFLSDEEAPETEDLSADHRLRAEKLTAIRTRDLKTGRFVGSPSLVTKKWSDRFFDGATGGADRKVKKKGQEMDAKMSVTLKKIKEKR